MTTSADTEKEKIVRAYYWAWERKDWNAIDRMLAGDFTFTSPVDDHISRSVFQSKCWKQAEYIERFDLDRIVIDHDEVLVKYRCRTKSGNAFVNIEYFTFSNASIEAIEVYFGGDLGFPSAASAGHR